MSVYNDEVRYEEEDFQEGYKIEIVEGFKNICPGRERTVWEKFPVPGSIPLESQLEE